MGSGDSSHSVYVMNVGKRYHATTSPQGIFQTPNAYIVVRKRLAAARSAKNQFVMIVPKTVRTTSQYVENAKERRCWTVADVIDMEQWLKAQLTERRDEMTVSELIKRHNKFNEIWIQRVRMLARERSDSHGPKSD